MIKKNVWNNIIFIQGDAAQLSLDFQVDGVLSSLGITAIPQHKQALRKAHSILKENGRISILDAQLPSGFWRIFNPLISYIYKHWASWDYTKKSQNIYNNYLETPKQYNTIAGQYILPTGESRCPEKTSHNKK